MEEKIRLVLRGVCVFASGRTYSEEDRGVECEIWVENPCQSWSCYSSCWERGNPGGRVSYGAPLLCCASRIALSHGLGLSRHRWVLSHCLLSQKTEVQSFLKAGGGQRPTDPWQCGAITKAAFSWQSRIGNCCFSNNAVNVSDMGHGR